MCYVDDALSKISDSRRLRQVRQLTVILALLSAVSVLGLLFQQVKPPFVQRVFGVSDRMAEQLGILIIALAITIIVFCLLIVFSSNKPARK